MPNLRPRLFWLCAAPLAWLFTFSCSGDPPEEGSGGASSGEGGAGGGAATGTGAGTGTGTGTGAATGTTTGTGAGGGAGAGTGAGGGEPAACADVSGDYGDCAMSLGWGYNGSECVSFSGCSCAPNCGQFFKDAFSCASTCGAAGKCDTTAMHAVYLAEDPFKEGNHCDGVYLCAPDSDKPALASLFPDMKCDGQPGSCPTGGTCDVYYNGAVTAEKWDALCVASLLPEVDDISCVVYGP